MSSYKTAEINFQISTSSSDIRTNATFFSQDYGLGKFRFKLINNTLPLDLTGATAILTIVTADQSTFQYTCDIGKDPTQGIAEIVLDKDVLQHIGTATAELTIVFSDSQSLSAGQFKFVIAQSLSDQSSGAIQYYIQSIENLKVQYQQEWESWFNTIKGQLGSDPAGNLQNQINDVTEQLADNTNKIGILNEQLNNKLDKNGSISVYQIDKNRGLIDETYLADSLKQQINGNAPISQTIADKSVTPNKTTFIITGKNLFNPINLSPGKMIEYNYGPLEDNSDHIATDYIEVLPSTSYVINKDYNIAFYDEYKMFISSAKITQTKLAGTSFTTPTGCKFIRFSIRGYSSNPNIANETQLEVGTTSTEFEPYKIIFDPQFIPKITNSMIEDKAVSIQKCDFFVVEKNLYDKTKATDGYLVNANDKGKVIPWSNHSVSDWIPIKPNTNYVWNVKCNYGFYDANKVFISGQNSLYAGTYQTSPPNAAFIRFSLDINTPGIKDNCQLEEGTIPTTYEPYRIVLNNQFLSIPPLTNDKFKNTKWNALGDSITEAGKYQSFVNSKLGFAVVRNYGVGGTKLADTTGSDANAMVNRYATMDNDADVITVMGGTNDWGQNVIISNPNNKYDKSTLKGAVRTIIEGLIAKYPGKYIIWATLPQRNNQTYPSGVNENGDTTFDYANAIKEVCQEYAIPCIDVHNECGINPLNMDTNGSLMPDRVHPSDAGYKRIASLFIDMFNKVVY